MAKVLAFVRRLFRRPAPQLSLPPVSAPTPEDFAYLVTHERFQCLGRHNGQVFLIGLRPLCGSTFVMYGPLDVAVSSAVHALRHDRVDELALVFRGATTRRAQS